MRRNILNSEKPAPAHRGNAKLVSTVILSFYSYNQANTNPILRLPNSTKHQTEKQYAETNPLSPPQSPRSVRSISRRVSSTESHPCEGVLSPASLNSGDRPSRPLPTTLSIPESCPLRGNGLPCNTPKHTELATHTSNHKFLASNCGIVNPGGLTNIIIRALAGLIVS